MADTDGDTIVDLVLATVPAAVGISFIYTEMGLKLD